MQTNRDAARLFVGVGRQASWRRLGRRLRITGTAAARPLASPPGGLIAPCASAVREAMPSPMMGNAIQIRK
jgi:hypothetical protein